MVRYVRLSFLYVALGKDVPDSHPRHKKPYDDIEIRIVSRSEMDVCPGGARPMLLAPTIAALGQRAGISCQSTLQTLPNHLAMIDGDCTVGIASFRSDSSRFEDWMHG